jgi:hypothetical protein
MKREMKMYILIIGSILLGAILGRFFKVLVLIPACTVTLAMVVASSAYEHSLLRALLEVVVLLTSLQIGYVSGLFSSFIPSVWQRRGKRSSLLSTTIVATAPVMARERRWRGGTQAMRHTDERH